MKFIVNTFKTLIDIIKLLFDVIMGIFSTIAMVFKYLITIVQLVFNVIATFPDWLKAFAIVTMAICVSYFIIGRDSGKNGD